MRVGSEAVPVWLFAGDEFCRLAGAFQFGAFIAVQFACHLVGFLRQLLLIQQVIDIAQQGKIQRAVRMETQSGLDVERSACSYCSFWIHGASIAKVVIVVFGVEQGRHLHFLHRLFDFAYLFQQVGEPEAVEAVAGFVVHCAAPCFHRLRIFLAQRQHFSVLELYEGVIGAELYRPSEVGNRGVVASKSAVIPPSAK